MWRKYIKDGKKVFVMGEMPMLLSGIAILFRVFYSPVLYFPISNSKVHTHNKILQIHPGSISCKV